MPVLKLTYIVDMKFVAMARLSYLLVIISLLILPDAGRW